MFWKLTVLSVAILLNLEVQGQDHLATYRKQNAVVAARKRSVHPEEFEFVSLMLNHPELIYSSFTRNGLQINATKILSETCNQHVMKVTEGWVAREHFALRRK